MVGIYIKVQGEEDLELREKMQLDSCKSMLKDNEEFKVYSDIGNVRTSRDEMLKNIENRSITKVVTYNFSGLSRNDKETIDILEMLKKNNIKLVTFQEGEINKSMLAIFSNFSKLEKMMMETSY